MVELLAEQGCLESANKRSRMRLRQQFAGLKGVACIRVHIHQAHGITAGQLRESSQPDVLTMPNDIDGKLMSLAAVRAEHVTSSIALRPFLRVLRRAEVLHHEPLCKTLQEVS